jgi:hypothetical protein
MRRDAALILDEAGKLPARADRARPEPFDHGIEDELLQPAPMNRELRHLETCSHAARLAPDDLPDAVHVEQFLGADACSIERWQEAPDQPAP